MLTLVSVKYGSSDWLLENAKLYHALNANQPYEWLVVNNDHDSGFLEHSNNFRILPGVERTPRADRGSYHHAAALMSALPEVKSRYLLILDQDFFVIRPNWMTELLDHMQHQNLAFFGSTWHPRWSYQYRYFPSVHFMLIDLEKIDLERLNFLPDIGGGWWDNLVSNKRIPFPNFLRRSLQVGLYRDTGFRIQQTFKNSRFECLIPHFDLEQEVAKLEPTERFLTRILPEQLNIIPQNPLSFTAQSFLKTSSRFAYEQHWEEFFWQDSPFAFHLRRVGRDAKDNQDFVELERLLARHMP